MRIKSLLFCVLMFPWIGIVAQRSIEGTVLDGKTGEPLIGATVLIKGTSAGTVTDLSGHYQLTSAQIEAGSTLVFSFIGYATVEVPAGNQNVIDVKLMPSTIDLEETVVIGYGTSKKRDVLGSLAKVNGEELTRLPVGGVEQALQGRVAGVNITQATGAPGDNFFVRIRGVSSIYASNDPLYIVDGIPTDNAFKMLSNDDIENVTILKDASAAAIYGSRATNGIIMITTKKGSKGQGRVNYHVEYGIQQHDKLVDMVDTKQYVQIYNEAATNDNASLPVSLQRPLIPDSDLSRFANENHLAAIFRTALLQKHELSFSGGNDKTNYYISASYYDQDGIIIGSNYKKGTTKVDINSNVKDWLTVGISMNASLSKQRIIGSSGDGYGGNGGSVIRYAFFRNPAIPIKDEDGNYVDLPSEYFGSTVYNSFLGDGYNPVGLAHNMDNVLKEDSYLGRGYVTVKLPFHFSSTTNIGIDYLNGNQRRFDRTWGTQNRINGTNRLQLVNTTHYNTTVNSVLNYDNTFSEKHNLTAMAGFEAVKTTAESKTMTDNNFPTQDESVLYIGNGLGIKTESQGEEASTLASFFGRVNYNYDNRFYASATLRRDGSSRFFYGNNKWGTFYAVSAGWNLDQDLLKDNPTINKMKLRVGYGAIGNQSIDPYAYSDYIAPDYNYPFGGSAQKGYVQTRLGNKDLRWETSYQYNAGIDLGLWQEAFTLSVDYYYKVTENTLMKASNPSSAGYADAPWINSGSILNTGVDCEVLYRHQKKDWGYSIGGNVAYLHNEVLKLDAPLLGGRVDNGVYATKTEKGYPIGSFYLLEMNGILQNNTQVLTSAYQGSDIKPGDVRFADHHKDGTIDNDDRIHLGSAIPKVTLGINLSANYKGFDLSGFFQGAFGQKEYLQVEHDIEGFYRGFTVTQRYYNHHWTGEGTSNSQPRASWSAKSNNARASSRFLEDASYLRLKNVQLGYTLPSNLCQYMKLEKVRVYVSGTNLLTFTKYTGLDPEMTVSDNSTNEQDRAAGIDWGTYPCAKSYLFGLEVSF